MKLTVSCQVCGTVLTVVENLNGFTEDDIQMYEQGCYCTVMSDGIDEDGQDNIIAIKTQD